MKATIIILALCFLLFAYIVSKAKVMKEDNDKYYEIQSRQKAK